MIDKATDFFDDIAKGMGLPIQMPRPNKKARTIIAVTNGMIGIVLAVTGVVISSKALVGLGAVGLLNSALLASKK